MNQPAEQNSESVYPDEILPPEESSSQPAADDSAWRRLESALGPILAGILIDVIDLSTFGPIGIFTGMLLGGALAFWICGIYGMTKKQRWIWALLAGAYCTIPMTEFIPVATLVGAYARYRQPPGQKGA